MEGGGNWVEVSQIELRSFKPQNQSGSFMEVRFFLPLVQLFEQLLSAHCVLGSVLTYWSFKEKQDVYSKRLWLPRDTHTQVLETLWSSSLDSPSIFLCDPSSSVSLAWPSISFFSFPALCLSLTTVHSYVFPNCVASSLSHTFLNLEVNDPVVRWTSLCLVFVCFVLTHGTLIEK